MDAQQSMLRVADLLETGLRSHGLDFSVVRPEPFFGLLAVHLPRLRKWLAYLDKYVVFPFSLIQRARDCRLVHIVDHANATYLFWLPKVKSVVTCYDLLAVRSALGEIPEHRTGFTGKLLQRWIRAGLRRASHIVCISEATRRDVVRLIGRNGSDVSRIYLGLEPRCAAKLNRNAGGTRAQDAHDRTGDGPEALAAPSSGYLLHVGGDTWYKNRRGVLRIYLEVRRRLGANAPGLTMVGPPLEPAIEGVTFLQNVRDADLPGLYQNAALLLFPSFYEGFGWPIVEAQACGCPVITTGRPPLTEAGGTAAVWIADPQDAGEAADRVLEVLRGDPVECERRRQAGYENATGFSLERMIANYLQLYTLVLQE
ncbi:MAG TPA: glycosyltransferase family 1 protein [Chthoniobacterales bacterium]